MRSKAIQPSAGSFCAFYQTPGHVILIITLLLKYKLLRRIIWSTYHQRKHKIAKIKNLECSDYIFG